MFFLVFYLLFKNYSILITKFNRYGIKYDSYKLVKVIISDDNNIRLKYLLK